MFPESEFDPLLSSFTMTQPRGLENYHVYEAIPQSVATDGQRSFLESPIRIWYRMDAGISFPSFLKKLRSELRRVGHKDSDSLIGSVIAIFGLHPERHSRPAAVLNHLLTSVVDGDLSQFFVFPHPPRSDFREFRMGSFSVGLLDSAKLSYRSKRAGSDYFSRYKQDLVGRFAVERDPIEAKVVDLYSLSKLYKSHHGCSDVWERCLNAYFQVLAASYFDDFWEMFMEHQHVLIAFGSSYIDARHVRDVPFVTPVSVFMNINATWGYVAPGLRRGIEVDFASIDRLIPETITTLDQEFGVKTGAEHAAVLKSYSYFTSKATVYANDGLTDEAFVHFVIALELLLGERSRSNESVSRRTATLVFRPLQSSIEETETKLNKLYDVRSKYVHAGVAVDPKYVVEVKSICREVLCALMRRLRSHGESPELVEQWEKDLDYLYSALQASKLPSEADFTECGIAGSSTKES